MLQPYAGVRIARPTSLPSFRSFSAALAFASGIGLVLVLSVDWFIGMARALGNLVGNCVATVVVAAWEGDLDRAKAAQVLEGGELVDVTAG